MEQKKQKQKIGADLLELEEGENRNQNQMRRKVGKNSRAIGLGYIREWRRSWV